MDRRYWQADLKSGEGWGDTERRSRAKLSLYYWLFRCAIKGLEAAGLR